MLKILSLFIVILSHDIFAQDTLKVLFVYGSKPKGKGEEKRFGGIHGGHISLQYKDGYASFIHNGPLHIFPKKKTNSLFIIEKDTQFTEDTSNSRYVIIDVPVTPIQSKAIDSVISERLINPEHDYAFMGYRCASYAYEIMAIAGIYKHYSPGKIKFKYFYPKLLRKRMLKEAKEKQWKLTFRAGPTTRKWEKD